VTGAAALRIAPSTIDLPWPPKELTPNARRRNHWRVTQRHSRAYRAECGWLTKVSDIRGGTITAITFFPPDRRRRDDDGMIGAFKAGRDGVADALGCDDHTFRPTYGFGEPVKGGIVRVEIGA
jgi:crossover junction endodeoxyribonuclease RusA